MSGQLHALALCPLEKGPRYHLYRRLYFSHSPSGHYEEEKKLHIPGIELEHRKQRVMTDGFMLSFHVVYVATYVATKHQLHLSQ
jgi:hypothetical protein